MPVGFFVTPGLATINRAELQAVASCLSAFPVSTVFTDSAFVVATWEKVQNADNLAALHACDHFDLVAQLFHVRGTPGQSVQKIQAHQVLWKILNPVHAYAALGNHLADACAKSAISAQNCVFRQEADALAQWSAATRELLKNFLQMLVELHRVAHGREKQIKKAAHEAPPTHDLSNSAMLSQWQCNGPFWQVEDPFPRSLLGAFLWGDTYAQLLWQWWAAIKWPTSPRPADPGVTHLELLISFLLSTALVRVIRLGI